jgi:hypothetical protein
MTPSKPDTEGNGAARATQRYDILADIVDRLEDEGDRVYLGSTNDAERLKALAQEIQPPSPQTVDDNPGIAQSDCPLCLQPSDGHCLAHQDCPLAEGNPSPTDPAVSLIVKEQDQ